MSYQPQTVLIERCINRELLPSNDMHTVALEFIAGNPRSSMREVAEAMRITPDKAGHVIEDLCYQQKIIPERSYGRWHGDRARFLYSVRFIQ